MLTHYYVYRSPDAKNYHVTEKQNSVTAVILFDSLQRLLHANWVLIQKHKNKIHGIYTEKNKHNHIKP